MKSPKLIVFDLDGTLYDINDVIQGVYDCQVSFFSKQRQISEDSVKAIFAGRGIFPCVSSESKSCTEYFESVGIDKDAWVAYRESHFDVSRIDVAKAVDSEIIRRFSSISSVYLLSSNTYNTILRILEWLHIDAGVFTRIISSDRFVSSNMFNKREAMATIIDGASIHSEEALSVGDRYQTDILPMLELGGHGVMVKSPRAVGELYERMSARNIEGGEDYVWYAPESRKTGVL